MSRIIGIISSLLLINTVSACSRDTDENREHYFQVYEEGGVTIAETSGVPKYEGELFSYEKVVEIQEDERPESILNRPTDFLADSQGRFYVADSGDARIAIFSPEGIYLRSLGRRGEGPGEFILPRIQSIRGDIVSIFDPRLRRETRYRIDGTLLDITSVPSSHPQLPDEFFHVDGERMAQIVGQFEEIENDGFEWVEVLIHTTKADTVAWLTTDRVLTHYRYPSESGGRQIMRRNNYLFAPTPQASYCPLHGFVMSSGDKPVLDIYDSSGVLQKRIRMDMPAERVIKNDRDAAIAPYEKQLAEAGEDQRNVMKDLLANLRFSDYKPPWYAFLVDDTGYFWLLDIEVLDIEEIVEQGIEAQILNPEGEYLGRTRMPPALFLKISTGRLLATNQNQETGEYTLTVYEIQPAVKGLEYP